MNVKRVSRLLRLLQTLRSGTAHDAESLARACGVSRRTVFRDMEALRSAGLPVAYGAEDRRYRVDAAHFLPPTNLTLEEALAVSVLLSSESLGSWAGPLAESARGAAAKIETSLPQSVRDRVRDASASLSLAHAPASPGNHDAAHQTLLRACTERVAVRIEYESLTEFTRISTELHPYHVLFHWRAWYVIGRSSLHRQVRTFRVARIVSATPLEKSFRTPRGFSIRKHLGNAWGLIPQPGPDFEVHLRFTPMVARNVAEVLWRPTQRCETREDGSLDFYVTVSGLSEIVWWVLGYGDQVEVLAPQRLRSQVAHRLRAAAERYGDRPSAATL